MKKWLIVSFTLIAALGVSYAAFRNSPNVSELTQIENSLKGAKLISVRVVSDSTDPNALIPRSEVQKVQVIKENYSALYDKLENSAAEWFWILQMNDDTVIGASGRWPAMTNDSDIHPPGRGFVEIRPGKATSQTKFGETPKDNDARYTTIYMSWVKNDVVSDVLSRIKH